MSTEVKKEGEGATPPADDRIKNLQAEFSRKLQNTEDLVKTQTNALMARIDAMAKANKPATPPPADDDLETEFYKNPAGAMARVKEATKKELRAEMEQQQADTNARNTVIQKLYKDYPELNDEDHDLTKRAIEIYNENAKDLGTSPATYKAAVQEAALEKGIKPKKLRSADETDAYTLSGRGDGSRKAPRKSDELSAETKQVAELLGVDPAKVKERQAKRKSFGKWE